MRNFQIQYCQKVSADWCLGHDVVLILLSFCCAQNTYIFLSSSESQTGRSANHEKWKHLIVFLFFICVSINLTKRRSYFICGFLNVLLIFCSQLMAQMRGAHLMSVLSNRNIYSCCLKKKKKKIVCKVLMPEVVKLIGCIEYRTEVGH